MTPRGRSAPRGFRWADTPGAQAALAALIVLSLGLSIYASTRYVGLVNCLQDRSAADSHRTAALAEAYDRERRAERALITGPATAELRRATLDAYAHTDKVRAAFPATGAATRVCG